MMCLGFDLWLYLFDLHSVAVDSARVNIDYSVWGGQMADSCNGATLAIKINRPLKSIDYCTCMSDEWVSEFQTLVYE